MKKYIYILLSIMILVSFSKSGSHGTEEVTKIVIESVDENSMSTADQTEEEAIQSTSFVNQIELLLIDLAYLVFFLFLFIIVLFIGGLAVYIYIYNKLKQTLHLEWNNYKLRIIEQNDKSFFARFSITSFVSILKERKDEYKEKSKEQIYNPAPQIIHSIPKENIKNDYHENDSKMTDTISSLNDTEDHYHNSSKLFFEIPGSEGVFENHFAKNKLSEDCFYIIEADNNTGKLIFNEKSVMRLALNNIDDYIRPSCEIENEYFLRDATKIEMIDTGKVELEADKWIIKKKIKIKLK